MDISPDESYPGVGCAVQAILASTAEQHEFKHLYPRAQEHLKVFDNPLYAHLDTPNWVARIWPETAAVRTKLTVRNVVKAMYDTAEDLGLDRLGPRGGGRYVAAAVCACAADAESPAGPSSEEREEALANGLQRLASTWAAFLLWPFYAHGWQEKRPTRPADPRSACATPPWFKTAATQSSLDEGNLQEKVVPRDGYRCVLTGFVDSGHYRRLAWAGCTDLPGGCQADLKAVNLFKRSLAVYSSPSSSGRGRDEFDSMGVTLEIMRHYCQLDRKYIDDAELMDKPKNAITLTPHFQTRFDCLTLCLKPTAIPHCYEVMDYEPLFNQLDLFRVPTQITFKSHMSEDLQSLPTNNLEATRPSTLRPSPREREATAVDGELPDPDLIRVHAALTGVLHLSGAYAAFDALFQPLAHSGHSAYPSPGGSAFWRSVVEYEGPESCVEVELREAVMALRRSVNSSARAAAALSAER